jgi:hypothetical protein
MALLISMVGNAVRSINPTLLDFPPPAIEESGHDICYLGPNGESSTDHVVYCKDLMEGHRAMVASWYLPPERHVVEYVIVVLISVLIIRYVQPRLTRYPKEKANELTPPLLIKGITSIIYTCQLIYKLNGYPGKILMMCMPCNVLWTIYMILCYLPIQTQSMHILYQLLIPYSILAIVAVATPDTSDITMWMEIPFFFIMHYALISFPIYLLYCGKISALTFLQQENNNGGIVINFLRWWVLACAYFALFYFGIAVPLSLRYGININYMLSPPPTPGDFLSGPNFRLFSIVACAVAFFISQWLVTSVAMILQIWTCKIATSKKSV